MLRNSLVALFLIFAFAATAQLRGKVVAIADGDSFTLLSEDKKQVKVRLHGIDCPEKKQDFGSKAKDFTSTQIFGRVVEVRQKSKDRYGRTVGIVRLPDGRILNEELLKAGWAWHYNAYDKNPAWANLEADARRRRLGLWSAPAPVAPWLFRKSKKKKPVGLYKAGRRNSPERTTR